jgi:4-hydroxy-tetrahydrodipicolinate synthase
MSEDGATLASEDVFKAYYDFLIGAGVHGLFICGTTGEGALLSMDERMRVTEWTVRQVAGRVPVIVQAGAMTTAHAVALATHAVSAGANAIAVLTPYFYPMDQEAMFQYFQTVATSAPALPVYLYNIPSFARNEISPDLVVRLRKACPNIAGIKHSDANLVRLQEYLAAGGEGFGVLAGADAVAVSALAAGAAGCVSGNASAVPEVSLALYQAVRRGDLAAARQQQQVLHEVRALLGDGHSLASFKAALRHRGLPVGGVRAPHRALTAEEDRQIERGLADLRRRGYLRTLVA